MSSDLPDTVCGSALPSTLPDWACFLAMLSTHLDDADWLLVSFPFEFDFEDEQEEAELPDECLRLRGIFSVEAALGGAVLGLFPLLLSPLLSSLSLCPPSASFVSPDRDLALSSRLSVLDLDDVLSAGLLVWDPCLALLLFPVSTDPDFLLSSQVLLLDPGLVLSSFFLSLEPDRGLSLRFLSADWPLCFASPDPDTVLPPCLSPTDPGGGF